MMNECSCNTENNHSRQAVYATDKLIELFWGLLQDGYTGLSMGLIVDLIERDIEDLKEGN